MLILFVFIAFIAGSALGSFLGVLVDRFPRGEQVLGGHSRCEKCKKALSPTDLVPIFSYIALSGRCRYCHAKIPIRLFYIEIITGLLVSSFFFYAYFTNLPPIVFVLLLLSFLSLLGIFLADSIYGIIPDEFIAAIIVSSLFLLLLSNPGSLVQNFITGIACFTLFLALYLVTRGKGMGFGDVKFAFALGFFLGFPKVVIGLYAAFLTAAIVSIILILIGRKKLRGDTIVFGPFLAAGTVFAYFFGEKIIKLFLG